jgi:hypothetical protein
METILNLLPHALCQCNVGRAIIRCIYTCVCYSKHGNPLLLILSSKSVDVPVLSKHSYYSEVTATNWWSCW